MRHTSSSTPATEYAACCRFTKSSSTYDVLTRFPGSFKNSTDQGDPCAFTCIVFLLSAIVILEPPSICGFGEVNSGKWRNMSRLFVITQDGTHRGSSAKAAAWVSAEEPAAADGGGLDIVLFTYI